jgi:hypothetical protein
MNKFGAILRSVTFAGALIGAGMAVSPALAAQSDIDLLSSYMGAWKGRGVVTGAESETVVCKLNLTSGNNKQITYDGKCTLAGSNLSIHGTIAYIDALKRYEAAMTTNASFTGFAVGKKQRDGVIFNLKERDTSEGKDWQITAAIALLNGEIQVDFKVIDANSGGSIKANIPFQK